MIIRQRPVGRSPRCSNSVSRSRMLVVVFIEPSLCIWKPLIEVEEYPREIPFPREMDPLAIPSRTLSPLANELLFRAIRRAAGDRGGFPFGSPNFYLHYRESRELRSAACKRCIVFFRFERARYWRLISPHLL